MTMRSLFHKRMTAALLAVVMVLSLLPGQTARALAADPDDDVRGSISATLRIDYAQSLETLRDREVRVEVLRGSTSLGTVPLTAFEAGSLSGGSQVLVSARSRDGGDLGGGSWPGYLDLELNGLPLDTYTLRFTGRGYVPFEQKVTFSNYAQHVLLGTGDGTFTLGDVNGDGKVSTADREALAAALQSQDPKDLERYDLNGDGLIDIVDLAYIDRQLNASGGAEVIPTALLNPPVVISDVENALADAGVTCEGGELADLFRDKADPQYINFHKTGGGDIVLPLPLDETTDMSEIRIVTPAAGQPGAILTGEILVEDAWENEMRIPFDYTTPEGVHAITRDPESNVITISLGKRVPVKKITITVVKTDAGYAAVESIQFLQDIVPENPAAPNTKVTDVAAEAGSESVRLRWRNLPNVSGYKILYWPQGKEDLTQELHVDVNSATVTGLENLKTYCFTVTATDGSWEGKPSEPVTATPQPAKVPDRVDMVTVTSMDGALRVGWKAAKGATWHALFYRDKDAAGWTLSGGRLEDTQATIEGLTNGVTYEIYAVGCNDIGRGPQSTIAEGTPKAVDYSRPAGIPTEGVLEYQDIESIRLADTGNYSHTAHPSGFQPASMADGDFRTHWTSQAWGDGNHARSKQVICTLKEPQHLTAALWIPRMDGTYSANLKAYTVTIWREGDDLSGPGTRIVPNENQEDGGLRTWETIPNNVVNDRFAFLPFEPVENVKQIAITIDQNGYTAVSLSELMFMTYSAERNLPGDIAALFASDLHTALKSGVTAEQIEALQARLDSDEKNYYLYVDVLQDELKLARSLLSGQGATGVVVNGIQARNGSADSRYGQGGSVLQPLGVAAGAGTELVIYAEGIPTDAPVSLVATQFNAQVNSWQKTVGTLRNGRNILAIPQITSDSDKTKGGSLYLTYGGSEANAQNIKLHVLRGTAIPTLELSNWYKLDDTARREAIGRYVDDLAQYAADTKISSPASDWRNVTEISTPSVLLSLPAAAVSAALGNGTREQKVETLCNDVLAWEDVMYICKTTQGISATYENNDMHTRQNIRCMTMFSGAFMYAAGSHIGIGYGSCGGMVVGKPVSMTGPGNANSLFGWGIAHEIGHNMDKLGRAEITNNIYSLMVQTYDGQSNTLTSRLEASSKYKDIFTKTAQGYPGAAGNVFVQLGMYWQLHLAYTSSTNSLDFYNKFFTAWKAGTYTGGAATYDEKVALTAAGVTGKNLNEFFRRWGMQLSDSVKSKISSYADEPRAIWYLSDASRRAALNGTTQASGTVTASVEKNGDKEVNLTFSFNGSGTIQGFEIIRNGTPIDFVIASSSGTYKDVIGSGNHRNYAYTVKAYDILGNEVGMANAGTVRIAYDNVIDPSTYTTENVENGVKFTFSEKTPVSGIKIAAGGWAENKEISVSVDNTYVIGSDTSVNQAVDDKGSYVRYLQMPGAASDDTRIYTYEALTVTVTGTGITDKSKVQLIGYPGDDIAFLETGSVGRLYSDYPSVTLAGSGTIAAGPLVIPGTYRGSPVFNNLRIDGRYLETTINEDGTQSEDLVEKPVAGAGLLFAAGVEGDMSLDVSDGFFLFVPADQGEIKLPDADELDKDFEEVKYNLPSEIKAVLSRSDTATGGSVHLGAETIWISSPGGEDLPYIKLENN